MKHILPLFLYTLCAIAAQNAAASETTIPGTTASRTETAIPTPTAEKGRITQTVEFQAIVSGMRPAQSSVSIKINPSPLFSLFLGNVRFAGMWNGFSKPATGTASATSQPAKPVHPLYIGFPSAAEKTPLSCALEFKAFSFIHTLVFVSGEKAAANQAPSLSFGKMSPGTGIYVPFEIEVYGRLLPEGISASAAFAWKSVPLTVERIPAYVSPSAAKKAGTLYTETLYSHAFMQQFDFKTAHSRLSMRFAQGNNPQTSAFQAFTRIYFIRSLLPYSYSLQWFMCTPHYVNQSGTSEKHSVKFSFNPQLTFVFAHSPIRSVKIGAASEIAYETPKKEAASETGKKPGSGKTKKGKKQNQSPWTAALKTGIVVQAPPVKTEVSCSVSDMRVIKKADSVYPAVHDKTSVTVKSLISFTPPYASKKVKRTWDWSCQWLCIPQGARILKEYRLTSSFSASFIPLERIRTTVGASAQLIFFAPQKTHTYERSYLIKLKAVSFIPLQYTRKNSVSLDTSCSFTGGENKANGFKGDITAKIRF